MDKSMIIAIFVVVIIFGGITLYAFEFTNLSNYQNPFSLLKWSLLLALPLSFLVCYLLYRDSYWVKPLVYRAMAFFSVVIVIFSPLLTHFINFYPDSRLLDKKVVQVEKVNGIIASRFGMAEIKRKTKSDYYHLLLRDENGLITYRMDDVSPSILQDSLELDIYLGFLGIPYNRISNAGI